MSNCIDVIYFNNNQLQLQMKFDGDSYETASVQFKLSAADRGVLEESPAIPVKMLFDIVFLIGMSVRRTAMQWEVEVKEMAKKLQGGKDGEKD